MRLLLKVICCYLLACVSLVFADDLTLETANRPPANTADEPLADSFSLAAATRFLDQASLEWTKSRQCFTCHTNFLYLIARPAVSADGRAHQEIRTALEELVTQRWLEKGPRWDAEVVMSAAVLAMNDRATTGKLHRTTREALDRMWTVQQGDGGFDWLKCGWPPMESDDDYGAAVGLIAAYAAPGAYANDTNVRRHLQKLYEYLERNPPPTLHHQAMLLWADSYGAQAMSDQQRAAAVEQLLALQKPDGGWAIATLGNWERADGTDQDTETSDGYATGFVVYVLRRAGIEAADARIQQGLDWLRDNQRTSGRWYTRSLNKDNQHFISHAGTAFAVMAFASCDRATEVPK